MKFLFKNIIATLLCMGAYGAMAQMDALKILSNGNVGVGNDVPSAKLHVGGPLNGTAMSTTFITNAGSLGKGYQSELSLASIGFTSAANKVALGIRALRSVNGNDSSWGTAAIGLGMEVDNTARASGSWLWLSANGRVGIGTAAPQKPLDISAEGGIRISRTEGLADVASKNEIFFQDNGQIRSADNNHRLIFNRSNNTMELREFGDIVFSAGTNGDDGTQAMVLKGNGRLGIGRANPDALLHIYNPKGKTELLMGANGGTGGYTAFSIGLSVEKSGFVDMQAIKASGTASGWGNLIINKSGGYVGIGTTDPLVPLHVKGRIANSFYLASYLDENGAGKAKQQRNDLFHSIISDGRVRAASYDVVSDARIKNIIGQSNSAKDLTTLMGINITDYQYKDVLGRGNNQYKKVIAQQVETVFPQAVGLTTDVVPDIYKKATFKNGWVVLFNDLKMGERVKLITGTEAAVYEVLEAKNSMFRINCAYAGNEVFVYGREVKDFRMVDYEAISMLNVSATQELVKQLEVLKKDNADMKKRLEALEAKSKKAEPAITGNVATFRKDA